MILFCLWFSLFLLFLRQIQLGSDRNVILGLLHPQQTAHFSYENILPSSSHFLYLLVKERRLGMPSLALNDVFDGGVTIRVSQPAVQSTFRIYFAAARTFVSFWHSIRCPISSEVQSLAWHCDVAVVNELELVVRLHFTVDMLAFWEDSVGDKLKPRTIKTCISEETRLVHNFRADES